MTALLAALSVLRRLVAEQDRTLTFTRQQRTERRVLGASLAANALLVLALVVK